MTETAMFSDVLGQFWKYMHKNTDVSSYCHDGNKYYGKSVFKKDLEQSLLEKKTYQRWEMLTSEQYIAESVAE